MAMVGADSMPCMCMMHRIWVNNLDAPTGSNAMACRHAAATVPVLRCIASTVLVFQLEVCFSSLSAAHYSWCMFVRISWPAGSCVHSHVWT